MLPFVNRFKTEKTRIVRKELRIPISIMLQLGVVLMFGILMLTIVSNVVVYENRYKTILVDFYAVESDKKHWETAINNEFKAYKIFSEERNLVSSVESELRESSSSENFLQRKPLSVVLVDVSDLSAKSIYAFNPYYYRISATKEIDKQRPIASLTKLVTVKTAQSIYKPDDYLVAKGAYTNLSVVAGLVAGDKIKFSEAIEASLVPSANDVAITMARSYKEGETEFIKKMNELAELLGMNDSNFSNASGLIDENNYSTAKDLEKIVMAVLNDPTLKGIIDNKTVSVSYVHNGRTVSKTFYNTNKLLFRNSSVKGVKTGYTGGAGQCVIELFDWGGTEKLVVIILGSNDRFGDAQKVADRVKKVWDGE